MNLFELIEIAFPEESALAGPARIKTMIEGFETRKFDELFQKTDGGPLQFGLIPVLQKIYDELPNLKEILQVLTAWFIMRTAQKKESHKEEETEESLDDYLHRTLKEGTKAGDFLRSRSGKRFTRATEEYYNNKRL